MIDMNHLAIIMDGNRRWAKERFMPAIFWHKAWFDNVKKITELAKNNGVKYLTLWALSTENLIKRESDEIEWIIKLISYVPKLVPEFIEKWVKLEVIWDIARLPKDTQKILSDTKLATKDNTGITLTVALVYGWQDEIIRATKKILQAWIDPELLTESEFRTYLDSSILPLPDMIIRTGWDIRHSGFLLYDSAYAEYYFTEKKWPEFDESEMLKALWIYKSRKRNFWI